MKFFVATCALVVIVCAGGASAAFDMQTSFDLIDANGDGWISHPEFSGLFGTFDDDGDSEINATEFITHFMKTGMSVQGSLYIFSAVDRNINGNLNMTEVEDFYKAIDNEMDDMLSYIEYASVMNTFLSQLKIAAAAQPRLDAMFDAADQDGDGMLVSSEFWISIPDGGVVTEDEFVAYWRNMTLETDDRARRIFHKFDFDGTPGLGGDVEKTTLFNAFDYGNDGKVDRMEFQNSMLSVFAQVMTDISVEVAGSFLNPNLNAQQIYQMMDMNNDMMISMEEFKSANNMTDTDQNGLVNISEFVIGNMKRGFTVKSSLYTFFYGDMNDDESLDAMEIKSAFARTDQNKDMSLSMDEFNRYLNFARRNIYFASRAAPKMASMVYSADLDGDDELTIDELKTLTAEADPDADGNINKDDFVTYWSTHTGFAKDISARLFKSLDHDMDGVSTEAERSGTFASFDYDKNGMVSTDEYGNGMLYIYAHIVRDMDVETWIKFKGTFNSTVFFHVLDTDKDGSLTDKDVDSYFKTVDTDADGMLSATEFVAAYSASGLTTEGSLYIFYRMDADQDQQLTKDEVSAALFRQDVNDDKMVSEAEYVGTFKVLSYQMSQAAIAARREGRLFYWADKNKDGNMTFTEMKTIFDYADSNKDGTLSLDEFKHFWMMETGEPADRTELLFAEVDQDDDGAFGNDQEYQDLFDGLDYGDDNLVSKQEFVFSLLNLFARTVSGLEAQQDAQALLSLFF